MNCKWLINGETDGIAMTLTTAHHFAGNIMYPRQGYREMGVLVVYEFADTY